MAQMTRRRQGLTRTDLELRRLLKDPEALQAQLAKIPPLPPPTSAQIEEEERRQAEDEEQHRLLSKPVQVRCASCDYLLHSIVRAYDYRSRRLDARMRPGVSLVELGDGRMRFSCRCGATPVVNSTRLYQKAVEAARTGRRRIPI
jgi:hypothetical protein